MVISRAVKYTRTSHTLGTCHDGREKTGRVRRRKAAPCHLRTTTRPKEKWQEAGGVAPKTSPEPPRFPGNASFSAAASGRAAGRGTGSRVGARPGEAPPAGRAPPRARGPPDSASGSGWELAPRRGPFPSGPTHRRWVWFSAASWGCREEAAEETRSGAPSPGHHTPRASRPGPRPPPPGAVPAPVPRGEPPQPPARSAARPLAAAAAASAPRAPASASRCRPGPPPGPSLRSRRCRQTRRAERRAAAPFQRPRPAGTIH